MASRISHIPPGLLIVGSFLFTIIIGALLLALPAAQKVPISFSDTLFTATSATCVTGIFTIPLTDFTPLGHFIILLLIQIGGLGLVTLSIFLISLFGSLGLSTQFMAGRLLELESFSNVRQVIIFIMTFTLSVELIGAALMYIVFAEHHSPLHALFLAIFHAVSSFSNAGITFSENSLIPYNTNILMLCTTTSLILFGGFGFITWQELVAYIKSCIQRKRYHFSWHSKIILYGGSIIIATTTLLILLFEYNGALGGLSLPFKGLNAFCQAVSFRGAGFLFLPLMNFYKATLLIGLAIAFIGTSPLSTSSGVKITTMAVIFATIRAALRGNSKVHLLKRKIIAPQIYKALAIVALSLLWICFIIVCLTFTESNLSFFEIVFEAVSSFANFGLKNTIPFSYTGKILIMASMIVGRVGSITLALALRDLTFGNEQDQREFSYPQERIMLS